MPIDPSLLVIKPVNQLTEVTGLQAGSMLFYDGSDNLKRISIDTFNNLSKTAKPLAPTDPTPTEEGLYIPTISGNYANAGGLIAQESYYTLFFFDGSNWTKSESEFPQATQYIIPFESSTFPIVGPTQRTYESSIWQLPSGQNSSSADVPGVSSKWISIGLKEIATYTIDQPTAAAFCLKTPIVNSDSGFLQLNLSLYKLSNSGVDSFEEEISIGTYISNGKVSSIIANSTGNKVFVKCSAVVDADGFLNLFFNELDDFNTYLTLSLTDAQASWVLSDKNVSAGFEIKTISNLSAWGTVHKVTDIKAADYTAVQKRTIFNGVNSYPLAAAIITPDTAIGSQCLKTPLNSSLGGFIQLHLSVYSLNSSASAVFSQNIIVSAYFSGGNTVLLGATGTGDAIVLNISTIFDGNNWRVLFNGLGDSNSYKHIVLNRVDTSFTLENENMTDKFSFSFETIASTSGWSAISKTALVTIPKAFQSPSTAVSNRDTAVINQLGFTGVFDILSEFVSKSLKWSKTLTGNVIISGDSVIDNVYGFDGLGDYIRCTGVKTDIATGGHTVADQVALWNAIPTLTKTNANYVFLQLGINNLNKDTDLSALIAELQAYVNKIKTDSPSAIITIGTITPYYDRFLEMYVSNPSDADIAQAKWVSFNEAIKGNGATPITSVNNRAYMHTELMKTNTGALKAIYNSGDQLHPNNYGKKEIYFSWMSVIE